MKKSRKTKDTPKWMIEELKEWLSGKSK